MKDNLGVIIVQMVIINFMIQKLLIISKICTF